MLDGLARVLRLGLDERDHLYRLAGHNVPDRLSRSPHVAPGLQRVLDALAGTPAFVISDLGVTLVQNALADALFGDPSRHRGRDRSGIHRWVHAARRGTGRVPAGRSGTAGSRPRRLAARRGRPPRAQVAAADLARDLERRSPEFAELWARQEVANRFEDHEVLLHPEIGAIRFDCQTLLTEDQSHALVVLSVAPRSADEEQLRLLSVVGMARFITSPAADPTAPDAVRRS